MARRMQDFDRAVAQLKRFFVFSFMNGEISLRMGAIYDRRSGSLRQIEMPTDEIGMEMSLENILDRSVPLFGKPKISVDIPQGIDDSRLAFTIYIVRRFTQTAGIQLLNEHNSAF
jgi:hypothetical protein